MKKLILLFSFALSLYHGQAQTNADTGTYILHKFEQAIGKETYAITHSNGLVSYDVQFKFTDRGTPVPMKAQLRTRENLQPVGLDIKGQTSRMSGIKMSIQMDNGKATITNSDSVQQVAYSPLSFPVGSYAPGTVQQVLLRFWESHGRPKKIDLLPAGSVEIRDAGRDTVRTEGKTLLLKSYTISGLIWGNELAWCDTKGQMICLITNDAEGDKLEMMSEPYENLLPQFIARAARITMRLFAASTGNMAGSKGGRLAITGATLIDVTGGPAITNSVVLIENGLIKQVGTMGTVAIPPSTRVIDARGKTLLPGLWDMHAHFEQAEWGPAYLAAGVTTVRDCGNELEYIDAVKSAIDAGQGVGPHILKAGIIDGPGPMGLGVIRASNKQEAIYAVDRYKNNGFAQIKIYSSVEPPVVKAICDEAHRLGLSVTGHIPEGMGLIQAIDSGMNQVNHIEYVYRAMKRGADKSIDLNDSSNKAVINFLRQHKVVVDPTLGVYEMSFRSEKDNVMALEPNFAALPIPLQQQFRSTGMPPEQAEKYKLVMNSITHLVKALYDEGIPIVAGTDMGFPGWSVDRELELYVAGGLTPMQALQTATIIPARVMGMEGKTGSITVGKSADLVLVDGDPLQNISNLRRVTLVIKDGKEYDPKALHHLVGFKD